MNHIRWEETKAQTGPNTVYGFWEDAKCFSIHYEMKGVPLNVYSRAPRLTSRFILKCSLPGFRPDLPLQANIPDAQAFAERMLQRWVAKRGLLFKSHLIVTDAMVTAVRQTVGAFELNDEQVKQLIEAALQAREPHAPTHRIPA